MSKINILDSSIYNRIAAGEVVENPKSIVKELAENSIDSGATSVLIEIRGGGVDYIKVSDNGCGMNKADLEKSVLPHATSKINNISDLNTISTLGFRGEALASIASVCELKITSRESGIEFGNFVEYDTGAFTNSGECGCPEGTTVVVQNLFGKIPARRKFLRKASSEAAEISSFISRIILANYNVSIKYICDDNIVYHSDGRGLLSAVYAVYGRDFSDNLISIEHVMPDINIYGFVGKPGFNKHSRAFQTLVVNGRYVINNEITYLIQNCYKDYLMTRQFPVHIIFIEIPPDMADVNVHPNKMDIKFADFGKIKKYLYATIQDAVSVLSAGLQTLSSNNDSSRPEIKPINKDSFGNDAFTVRKATDFQKEIFSSESSGDASRQNTAESLFDNLRTGLISVGGMMKENRISSNTKKSTVDTSKVDSSNADTNKQDVVKNDARRLEEISVNADNIIYDLHQNKQQEIVIDENFGIKILCKIFNTYILIEYKNDIFLIDQHAAHERIIFDKLVRCADSAELNLQPLLLPYVFDLSHVEAQILSDNLEQLESMGFSISSLSGNSFSLNTVPLELINVNYQEFLSYFFDNVGKNKLKESDLLRDKIARAACKAAVKGRDDLNTNEIIELLQKMSTVQKLFCPHGRPVMIKITKHEIERWFKRIL